MSNTEKTHAPVDAPLAVYRLLKQFVLVLLVGVLIKWLFFGTMVIRTDHMAPALHAGDRVLLWRGVARPVLKHFFQPRAGAVVVFDFPHRGSARGCLRVAAGPGDTVAISRGRFVSIPDSAVPAPLPQDSVLPPEYSPRDFTAPFRLPRPGDTYQLDSLTQRDFIFAASMRAQEYPGRTHDVQPTLFIDGIPSNEYIIENFLLYEGAFDSIPDSLDYDWFFWDRLRDNLRYSLENREVRLEFALMENGKKVEAYRVRKRFYFLLADNWVSGFDSRYFGPVSAARLRGSVPLTLWSRKGKRVFSRIPPRREERAPAPPVSASDTTSAPDSLTTE
ncbi:MAG: hypothetical protein GF331_19915 [Chitinivibrionales bacterium]|nr:hypothetical protein [Chitinivibrionales bacterium]